MTEMRLPHWLRAILLIAALAQAAFGLTLVLEPGEAAFAWPWPLPPLTARLLGATAVASAMMALPVAVIGRYAAAMIPLAMMLTGHVVQLAVGLVHLDRFDSGSAASLAYFAGNLLMLVVVAYALITGARGRLPAATGRLFAEPRAWQPEEGVRDVLRAAAGVYLILGLGFLFAGGEAGFLWIDRAGLAAETARLFAAPLLGLAVGLFLVGLATDRRAIAIPALGLIAIGPTANLALVLARASFAPNTPAAWLVAVTPSVLMGLGIMVLVVPTKKLEDEDEDDAEEAVAPS